MILDSPNKKSTPIYGFSQIKARKSLGQNFLIDPNIIRKIVDAGQLSLRDVVLEIGPGLGALTHKIAQNVKHLIAVETDLNLYKKLSEDVVNTNITLIHEDFLKYDFKKLPQNMKLIGNIPYYISSPIVNKILEHREHFSQVFLTVQLEFAKRLCAQVNTKDYSSLSCFVQYFSKVEILFKIKNTCFKPSPKVDSCFVKLSPYESLPLKARNEELLFKMIRNSFQQRRKMLSKTLLGVISDRHSIDAILYRLNLGPGLRPENLTLKNFVDLADAIGEIA